MSRQWRIEFPGAMYHIMARGNEGNMIYCDNEDRKCFIRLLSMLVQRFQTEIHAWVLMPNHYHLLLKTPKPNLSKSMQWFGSVYTRRYNLRHSRKGHLFQGRFKSLLVENDEYLLRLSYYIHRNPLKSNLTNRLANYPWSSYISYAYGDNRYEWLTTEAILALLPSKNKHLAYRKMAQNYANEEDGQLEHIHLGLVFGTKEFASKIKKQFLPKERDGELPQQRKRHEDIDINYLLMESCKVLECDLDSFRKSKRIRSTDIIKRDILISFLWNSGLFTNIEIGQCFGLTYSSVSRRAAIAKVKIENNPDYFSLFSKIKSLIKI
jgi:REP-associated tyrosine transposase